MSLTLIATILTGAAVLALLVIGKSLLIPFAIAVMLWYVIDAIAAHFRRFSIRGFYPFERFAVIPALLVVILLLMGLVQMIGDTVQQVSIAAPAYEDNINKIMTQFSSFTGVEIGPSLQHWFGSLNLGKIISSIAGAIMAITGNAGLVAIYIAFLLMEERYFSIKLCIMFPDLEHRRKIEKMLQDIQIQIRQYLYVKTLVSALTGIISYAILVWVGVDYAPFWALLIFMLNFIPTIGSLIAVLLPTALALVQFDTITPFITLLVSLGSVQMLIGNVLEPRVMGSSLNLSPLVVILALSLWGEIWGITGMFLSVPITVIAMIVLGSFPATRSIAVAMSENGRLRPVS
jgi:predicted PurR-regulated permease PerM